MKYQVGDIVILLHSGEEGRIVDFINDKMAMVEVQGVTFPVYLDQVDFPYFKRFTEKPKEPPPGKKRHVDDLPKEKRSAAPQQRTEAGVMLSFVPDLDVDEFGDDYVTRLRIYLLNQTATTYLFEYTLLYFGKKDMELKNEIFPHSDFYLHDMPFENLNDSPSFEFVFRLAQKDPRKEANITASLRLKPRQLFKKIEEIRKENRASFTQMLFEHYPDKLPDAPVEMGPRAKSGGILYDAGRAREFLEPAQSVVDLHAEKLVDRPGRLKPQEILALQLKTFEKYYQLAVVHLQPGLIIIHGVGEGRLRDEIHERLRRKKEVKTFVNQYHPLYGFGATEIFFQYNT